MELRRSWWVLLTLVPIGLTGWGAFVYAGTRARQRSWTLSGVGYLALLVAGMILAVVAEDDSALGTLGGLLLILAWIVPFVHALVIRRAYLERTAVLGDPRLARGRRLQRERSAALAILRRDPAEAREVGVGRPDVEGAFHGGLVDLNHADAGTLARLPEFDDALAARAVAVREEIDGFSSLEDVGHVLGLSAATVDAIRDRAVVVPRASQRG